MRGPRPGTGEKISKTLKERNHSHYYTDEIKEKISQGNKGKPKPFTDSHKIAMGIAKRKQAKTVIQYDLNGNFIKEWEGVKVAALYLGCDPTTITANLKGQTKKGYGYIWKRKTI